MGRNRALARHVRERFLVTNLSGQTWDGLLQDWDDEHLVFVNVKAHDKGQWVPLDGELWLQRTVIDFMQRP